jgi:hypothetical protein
MRTRAATTWGLIPTRGFLLQSHRAMAAKRAGAIRTAKATTHVSLLALTWTARAAQATVPGTSTVLSTSTETTPYGLDSNYDGVGCE